MEKRFVIDHEQVAAMATSLGISTHQVAAAAMDAATVTQSMTLQTHALIGALEGIAPKRKFSQTIKATIK